MALNIPFFQCFMFTEQGSYAPITAHDEAEFLEIRKKHFQQLYVHGSYWINLCSVQDEPERILWRELRMAKRLEFTHFIVHPGCALGNQSREEGIGRLATVLNRLLRHEHDITVVLENTAHGDLSVGSDITDFKYLLEYIDNPDRVKFCIDTAHAYSFGYDIADLPKQQAFIELIDQTIGIERIALLHVNDTDEACGCKIDRHKLIGSGHLGVDALQRFVQHPRLRTIPVILELPKTDAEQEREVLKLVRSWYV